MTYFGGRYGAILSGTSSPKLRILDKVEKPFDAWNAI
jgi:hypothetical protein